MAAPHTGKHLPIFQVDAFTDEAFAGNPAAICLVPTDRHGVADELSHGMGNLSEDLMKKIAAEMNLSETAFVTTRPPGLDFEHAVDFHMRWFTPKVEVPLCGHATLAAAHIIFDHYKNPARAVTFQTLSGPLVAEKHEAGHVAIFLPTAATAPFEQADVNVPNLDAIVHAAVGAATPIHSLHYVPSRKRLLVRLADSVGRPGIEKIVPDVSKMLQLHDGNQFSSVTITVLGDGHYHFFSRHFSPWIGIPEDPVTGSAHSYISTYWSSVLGEREFLARQCSPRGGDLKIALLEDGRMRIIGESKLVVSGQLYL